MTNANIDAHIERIELAFNAVQAARDAITLAQYRRLRILRYQFAEFLTGAIKVDNAPGYKEPT